MNLVELWIVYKDVNHGKAIKNVTNYGFDNSIGMFFFEKNGYLSFMPTDSIRFFGPKADYFNLEEQSNEE